MRKIVNLGFLFILLCSTVFTQSTEFTYQGRLTVGSVAATTNHDFEFRLYDAPAPGGTLLGTQSRPNVPVSNGVFSVNLDFGANFTGAARYLEIAVKPAGGPTYTILDPRQPVTSAPHNIKSLSASSADIAINSNQLGGVAAAQYVITTDPRMIDSRMPTAGSNNYIQSNPLSQQLNSSFDIAGNGTAGVFNATGWFAFNGQRVLRAPGTENLFAGVNAGGGTDIGTGNSFFGFDAGRQIQGGVNNSFFGRYAGGGNRTGYENTFFGYLTGQRTIGQYENTFIGARAGLNSGLNDFTDQAVRNTFVGFAAGLSNAAGGRNTAFGAGADIGSGGNVINATAIGANAFVTQNNSMVLGSINGTNGATANTNVGIGTTAPSERLHVVGNGLFTGNLTVNGTLNANIPSGSGNYIQNNPPTQQSANFNISGNGTAAGTLRGAIISATTQFDIGTVRILAAPTGQNLFAGVGAGINDPGSENAFFGPFAGNRHVSGDGNSFFGHSAGYGPLSGVFTGSFNSFFGSNSGLNSSSGSFNSFFGHRAGERNGGDSNSFFGTGAGLRNSSGNSNTFIGHDAGDANTGGSFNTIIGDLADVGTGNLTNATAIGAKTIVTQSNSLVLGSINGVGTATADTNVGIGIPAPAFKLHVIDPSNTGLRVQTNATGGTVASFGGNGAFQIDASGTAGGRFTVLQSGDVGIGTSSPIARLDVAGTIRVATLAAPGLTPLCRDNFSIVSSCSSSIRYKQNINTFTSGFDLINRLRPVTFNWKADNSADMGLVAEEVAEIEPLLAAYNDKGEVEGVKYDRVGVVLINVVKEQQAQIEAQAKQIETLKHVVCKLSPTEEICANR